MAHNDFKRYVWLVDLLNNVDGASFQDINDAWQDEPELNPEGKELPLRTFYNHLTAIKSIFDITIERTRTDGKYRVAINDNQFSGRMKRVLMSTLSLNNVVDQYKNLKGRVLYESEPFIYPEWMSRILHAMNYGRMIRLEYRKYGEERSSSRELSPYCLKMFKRRWYLLALQGKTLKTFALDDRTRNVKELDKTFGFPDDFDADSYFQDTFGIRKASPKRVILKAYGQEADYMRSAPLHPSQKELEASDDYTIFSLNVGIDAWEFIQELLSRGDRIEVLEPLSLRQSIASIIEDMRGRYAEFWQK